MTNSIEHHVESYIGDSFVDALRTFGWQCFTCGEEAGGFDDLNAADAAADQHRAGAMTSD